MKVLKGLKILVCIVVAVIAFGFVTEHLWNWLIPSLFHLRTISFKEAIGLVLLSKILFGGFHRHGGHRGKWDHRGGRREWKRRMKERYEHMSPEERERFKQAMKERWGHHGNCGPWGRKDWNKEGFGPTEETKG
jgi:hypothetical protein